MTTLTVTSSHDYRSDTLSNITNIVFQAPSGQPIATFAPEQFDGTHISTTVSITGSNLTDTIKIVFSAPATFSAAGWTFSSNWGTIGTDGLLINGSSGADNITGSSQHDNITGGGGADALNGGGGNDDFIYLPGDLVAGESVDGGAGTDIILLQNQGVYDFSTATVTNVEIFSINGSTATFLASQLGAHPEFVGSSIGPDTLTVNGSVDLSGATFSSWEARDSIFINGTSGSDTLTGSANADTIAGGAGADTLRGGLGDDTYVLQDVHRTDPLLLDFAYDTVTEQAGGGTDTVEVSRVSPFVARYTLPANVENGIIQGTGTFSLFGNELDNRLSGNGDANTLDGKGGADTLQGGASADTFVFGHGYGNDTVLDFLSSEGDRIDLRGLPHINSFSQVLSHASQFGSDTVLNFGNGDTLTLTGVLRASLQASSFILSPPSAQRDFNADRSSDILWHAGSGDTAVATIVQNQQTNWQDGGIIPPSLQIAATADFDGDGVTDLLWHASGSGDTAIATYQAGSQTSWTDLGNYPTVFSIAGAGDFNGDGLSDILWRAANGDTTISTIQNGSQVQWTDLGVYPTFFDVVRTADFNGDGTADILFHSSTSGNTAIATIQNDQQVSWTDLGNYPTFFQVAGLGDFNGDGTADILWRRADTGGMAVSSIQNGQQVQWTDLGIYPTQFDIGAIGDYNNDGTSDILFHAASSGDTAIASLQNNQQVNWTDMGNVPTFLTPVGV